MAPDIKDMKCVVCQELKTVDEISKYEGMCEDCFVALRDTAEEFEKDGEDKLSEEELSPEMQKAVRDYQKRQEYMREYNSRPKVIAKRKQYNKDKQAREKLLREKARRLGLL